MNKDVHRLYAKVKQKRRKSANVKGCTSVIYQVLELATVQITYYYVIKYCLKQLVNILSIYLMQKDSSKYNLHFSNVCMIIYYLKINMENVSFHILIIYTAKFS